jgi:hypothetical protein
MRYLSSLALVALLTILSYCAAASVAHGQTAGDYYFLKWDGTKFVEVYRSPNSTDLIGYDGSGNLANIPRNTFAPLSHTQAWSTITATPTTLSGYGITDAITAAAVAAAYHPLNANTTGNAATATALQTARTINGTSFDGTANITVTAAAGTLTGSTLASGVTASSLTSVGTLSTLAVSTGTLTSSTPTTWASTWNAGGVTFAGITESLTLTAAANGSKLRDWIVGGSSVMSIAYNTTGSSDASPWRLVFGSSASIGWAAGWGAVSLRNAANSAEVNFRASQIQGTSGVFGTNYISIGSGSEGDAQLSSASWRGAGLRLRDTASIVWTSTSTAAGTDRNFIRGGAGSPEGVVTANVGSLWLRTDGGASTTIYVKESGTGNTGWIAK